MRASTSLGSAATSFDRTYEGLKHSDCPPLLALREGFDRTYEGLKHGQLLQPLRELLVLTVPMRV